MALTDLEWVLRARWGWSRNDVHQALLELAEQTLLILHEGNQQPSPLFVGMGGLRNGEGKLVDSVSLAIRLKARPKRR